MYRENIFYYIHLDKLKSVITFDSIFIYIIMINHINDRYEIHIDLLCESSETVSSLSKHYPRQLVVSPCSISRPGRTWSNASEKYASPTWSSREISEYLGRVSPVARQPTSRTHHLLLLLTSILALYPLPSFPLQGSFSSSSSSSSLPPPPLPPRPPTLFQNSPFVSSVTRYPPPVSRPRISPPSSSRVRGFPQPLPQRPRWGTSEPQAAIFQVAHLREVPRLVRTHPEKF